MIKFSFRVCLRENVVSYTGSCVRVVDSCAIVCRSIGQPIDQSFHAFLVQALSLCTPFSLSSTSFRDLLSPQTLLLPLGFVAVGFGKLRPIQNQTGAVNLGQVRLFLKEQVISSQPRPLLLHSLFLLSVR